MVGKIVTHAIEGGKELQELDLSEFSELICEDVYEALSLEQTLGSKSQIGGTAREAVDAALKEATDDADKKTIHTD